MGVNQMSNRQRLARCAVIAVAVSAVMRIGSVFAAEPDHYVSVGIAYTEPDTGRRADYGAGVSVGYGGRFGPSRWWELKLFNHILETGSQPGIAAIDFYRSGLDLDLLQPLGDESRGHFFLLGGGGVVLNDVKPDSNDGTSVYLNIGGGWRVNASENWGVRPRIELRYIYDSFDSGQSDFQLGLTLEIPPRTERVVGKVVEVEKIVEVPVTVEKIVETDAECVVPPEMSPTAPAPDPPPPPDGTGNDGVERSK